MTARDIIERLHGLGVDLSINGESVHYAATLDAPPADLLAALKSNKAAVLALLRSCPTYTHDEQLALSAFYCAQLRTDRLRIHRRGVALRNEDGLPFHVAQWLAIQSERDNFNPRVKLRASAPEGIGA
jgi:hypothetical protein